MEIIIIAILLVANLCIGICWVRELRKVNKNIGNHYILYCKARIIKENYGNGGYFNWIKYEKDDVDDNSRFLEHFNANEEVEIYIRRKQV